MVLTGRRAPRAVFSPSELHPMSKRRLNVGAIVHIRQVSLTARDGAATFRIEELLRLDDGGTLYKVKSDIEPFDHIVAERDLALRP